MRQIISSRLFPFVYFTNAPYLDIHLGEGLLEMFDNKCKNSHYPHRVDLQF